jgi:hypothetical protein
MKFSPASCPNAQQRGLMCASVSGFLSSGLSRVDLPDER